MDKELRIRQSLHDLDALYMRIDHLLNSIERLVDITTTTTAKRGNGMTRYFNDQEKYESWWLNKHCRLSGSNTDFKKVVRINLHGPPSFVYGSVELIYKDYSAENVFCGDAFKPRKKDVEIKGE